jgi:hypothetical protein
MKGTEQHLLNAARELAEAEGSEDCTWCRSHIRQLRILTEDMLALARSGDELGTARLARETGLLLEKIGALSVMARIIHWLKRRPHAD